MSQRLVSQLSQLMTATLVISLVAGTMIHQLSAFNLRGLVRVGPNIKYPARSSRFCSSTSLLFSTLHPDWSSIDKFVLLPKSLLLVGDVAPGYGRGSKKLGVPTANLPYFDKELMQDDISLGVYFGWCKVAGDDDCCAVIANIGKSPTFEGQENSVRIVEAHLVNRDSDQDFYGSEMRVGLVGYLRPEKKFSDMDSLLSAIRNDISLAIELDRESNEKNLMKRRASLSSMEDCLAPMYILGERRLKILEFLNAQHDDKFNKKYICKNVNDGEGPQALWCSMVLE